MMIMGSTMPKVNLGLLIPKRLMGYLTRRVMKWEMTESMKGITRNGRVMKMVMRNGLTMKNGLMTKNHMMKIPMMKNGLMTKNPMVKIHLKRGQTKKKQKNTKRWHLQGKRKPKIGMILGNVSKILISRMIKTARKGSDSRTWGSVLIVSA